MILSKDTNRVCFSAHIQSDYPKFFKRMKSVLEQYSIQVELLNDTEDYWCRDYMPIQVDENRFVTYQYCPDYLKEPAKTRYITGWGMPWKQLGLNENFLVSMDNIVFDGGNVVKTPLSCDYD